MTVLEERLNKKEERVSQSEMIMEQRLARLDERASRHTTDRIRALEEKLDKLLYLIDGTRTEIENELISKLKTALLKPLR